MQHTRVIAVPGSGGAAVVIRCTRVTSRMTIDEDTLANPGVGQGLIYRELTPKSAAVANAWTAGPAIQALPADYPIVFEPRSGDNSPNKGQLGNGGSAPYPVSPGGPVTLGTPVCSITSASLVATTIDVTEWD